MFKVLNGLVVRILMVSRNLDVWKELYSLVLRNLSLVLRMTWMLMIKAVRKELFGVEDDPGVSDSGCFEGVGV